MTAAPPVLAGPARRGASPFDVARRLEPGDVAIIDVADLDRRTGEALAVRRPVAVINAGRSLTGRLPVTGALILIDAGVAIIDGAGEGVLTVRDGAGVVVREGEVLVDDAVVARGERLTPEGLADAIRAAGEDLHIHVASFTANALDVLDRDAPLLLDGAGLPELRVPVAGRPVVVVTPRYLDDVPALARFVRERRPVVIGVGAGADAARTAGLVPRIVLGDIDAVGEDVLRRATQVIAHDPLGRDAGRRRAQAIGLSCDVCDATLDSEEIAVLASHAAGASVVVVAGAREGLLDYLEERSASGAGALLARLVAGGTVVDARVVAALYRHRYSAWTAWGALGLSTAAVALAVWGTPEGHDAIVALVGWLSDAWGGGR